MTAKLKLETPAEKLIIKEKAKIESEVIDEDGKVYKLKIPDALEKVDYNVALGQHSTNFGVILNTSPLIYIDSIDGVPFTFPGTWNGIRAAVKVVGTNGMEAVGAAVQKYMQALQLNSQETIDSIKK